MDKTAEKHCTCPNCRAKLIVSDTRKRVFDDYQYFCIVDKSEEFQVIRFFGKDLYNAYYVCPTNLKAEHDKYVEKKQQHINRERKAEAKRQALKDEAVFQELKSKFFGIQFTDGTIQIRVLESVTEIMQEGDAMHHCVFTNDYHLRPDSLILSACIDGERIETVELSLSKLKVVQSRGACNKNTEHHDRIVNLVNKNISLINKRIAV